MKNNDIINRLNAEMSRVATPDVLDRVRNNSSINTNKQPTKVKHSYRQLALMSSLVIILIAVILPLQIFIFSFDREAAAIISIDINPSIELTVNAQGEVISATSNNNDGQIILESMNLRRKSLDQAITAILEKTETKGYDTTNINYNINTNNSELREAFKGRVNTNTQGYYNRKNMQGNINWTENTTNNPSENNSSENPGNPSNPGNPGNPPGNNPSNTSGNPFRN